MENRAGLTVLDAQANGPDWLEQLSSTLNGLNFWLRRQVRWRHPAFHEPGCQASKRQLFAQRPDGPLFAEREAALLARYPLDDLLPRVSPIRYLETLTYLEHLDRLVGSMPWPEADSDGRFAWLDVGAKNWLYVEALTRFARQRCDTFELVGIELDAYRVYEDLHSRYDYARHFIQAIPEARYEVADVCTHWRRYQVITHFLPFVLSDPLLAWGLPLQEFKPVEILRHLLEILEPDGYLLIVNQGEAEVEAQRALLDAVDPDGHWLERVFVGELPQAFQPAYQMPRFGWRCRKKSAPPSE
jgi:hypothetical protein